MIDLVTFLFGLLFGSFLNVCIYRIPRIHLQLTEQSFQQLATRRAPRANASLHLPVARRQFLKACWHKWLRPLLHFWGGFSTSVADGVPAELLVKLEPLQNKEYITGNDFIAALEGRLGKAPLNQYGDLIFQAAAFKKESIAFPASHCPNCQTAIKPWDNIPLLSFLLLGGKCRACRAKISWRYPLVELLTGLLFVAVVEQFSLTLVTLVYLGFVLALIAISFIDMDHQIIPDQLTFPGLIIGLLASFFLPLPATLSHWYGSILGAIVGGGSIALIGYGGALVFKKEAMGAGDVKLMAMIGAFLGWQLVLLTMIWGSFAGAIVGIIIKLITRNEYIPFGPFLSFGAVSALFFGQQFLFWYWHVLN